MEVAYLKLSIVTVIPVIVAVVLYLLNKMTKFEKLNEKVKQAIYGVVFGLLAIFGTEFGVPMNGAQMNCRDASVLIAGLLFGAPAGIIAGLIGGIERWFAVYWGVGSFTRLACTVSTIIAGGYSAMLRKFMFEDKKPGFLISLAIGIVMEVFHITMVFITNMNTPIEAMAVVKACTVPMLIANGVSVMFSAMAISFLGKDRINSKPSKIRISQTIQLWLLCAVVIAFGLTSYFVFSLQSTIALTQADNHLNLAIKELSLDIEDATNLELNVDDYIKTAAKNRNVGETGYAIIIDKEYNVISKPESITNDAIGDGLKGIDTPEEDTSFNIFIAGEKLYGKYQISNGYYVMAFLPEAEALQMRNIAIYVNTFMEIMVFAILFGLIYLLIKKVVVNQIQTINGSLAKITGGDLDVVVNVRTSEEFASLSDDINSTVDTLKRYIAEASQRIDKELEFAKNIQSSVLPNVFPAFPKRKDFDIYASMNPAKEVGGDFYDFYLTDNDKFHIVVADVSGKGIPAAMFMMRAKTELKTLTESGINISEVFTNGNKALCEGNDAGMFVTAWQGDIDLQTGLISFANAGHNPPLVKRADGKFEYLKTRAGFVLAGMDGVQYKSQELQLGVGDIVYIYTDGVTEAQNVSGELFGEERLLNAVNSKEFENTQELCEFVKGEVDKFVGEASQFDDITMLAFKYIGKKPCPTIDFEKASLDDIPKVTEFIETELEKIDCPMKTVLQINVAIDEIYSNIVKYAYPKEKGPTSVKLVIKDEPRSVYVRFSDEGIPYNPLTKEDPDVTLSAEERNIGGLGIYMVKKTMDTVKYKYEEGKNVLTICKKL